MAGVAVARAVRPGVRVDALAPQPSLHGRRIGRVGVVPAQADEPRVVRGVVLRHGWAPPGLRDRRYQPREGPGATARMRCHDPGTRPGRATSSGPRRGSRRWPSRSPWSAAAPRRRPRCRAPAGRPRPRPPRGPAGSGIPAGEPALAAALRDAVDPDAILADLRRLEDIALANEGNRAAGSASEAEAAQYVADELRAAGFDVELQRRSRCRGSARTRRACSRSTAGERRSRTSTTSRRCCSRRAATSAGRSTRSASIRPRRPAIAPGSAATRPISADVPAGAIVLVRPGPCLRRDVVLNAQAAGAVALVTAYPEWQRDTVLRPTLIDPDGLEIPALAASNDAGLALLDAAQRGASGHIVVETTVEDRTSVNVIAETVGGVRRPRPHHRRPHRFGDRRAGHQRRRQRDDDDPRDRAAAGRRDDRPAEPGRGRLEGPHRVLDRRGDRPARVRRLRAGPGLDRGRLDRGVPQLRHARLAERRPGDLRAARRRRGRRRARRSRRCSPPPSTGSGCRGASRRWAAGPTTPRSTAS